MISKKPLSYLSDVLPWAAFIAPAVLLNKNGSFQTTIKYRGPDLDSVTDEELLVNASQINNILRRLGTNYALFFDAHRVISNSYPENEFPDPVSSLLDSNRKEAFSKNTHFESEYYLTINYLPPSDNTNKLTSLFISSNDQRESVNADFLLESYQAEILRIVELFSRVMQDVTVLSPDETLTYLHSLVSTKKHNIKLPEVPMYLDAYLTDTPLLGGFNPILGEKHLKVISIMAFPGTTHPAILDALNRLPIEYRWSTRFISLDKYDGKKEIETYQRYWFAKRKKLTSLIYELFSKTESTNLDLDSLNKAEDAQSALSEISTDEIAYGHYTSSLVLMDEDLSKLRSCVSQLERIINGAGFVSRVETVNSVDAWLGTIPGNTKSNIRRPLLNTLNLSHLMPGSSAVWGGEKYNSHLEDNCLFVAETNGCTPFRFNLHVGDVGHTLILGPTGSGKSTLLSFIEAQFLRYQDAQVYIFDKGASALALTSVVGGEYFALGAEKSDLSFQPLSSIDEEEEKKWAHEFIIEIFAKENVKVTPEVKRVVWEALESLAGSPKEQRTLLGLSIFLQNQELRAALQPYTRNGPHGKILDNSHDTLRLSKWMCFEMEELMDTPSVIFPVLSYLFHRLEERFDGKPTILVLDEAWVFLDSPLFAAKIREWLKTLRKKNVSVIFATQSLADVQSSSISSAIKESCFTKVYLPNQIALQPDMANFYKGFGLNAAQIEIIAKSTPKKDYYYSSPSGNRLFDLALDELTLAFCAGANPVQRKKINELREKSKDPLFIATEYLRFKGLNKEADYLNDLRRQAA